MIKKEKKELMLNLLKVLFPGAKIYLFGSMARGDATDSSDIDLAIDADRVLDSLEIARAINVVQAVTSSR